MARMPADEFFEEVRSYFKDGETPENTVLLNWNERGDIDYLIRVHSPVLRKKTSQDTEFCEINCSKETWTHLLDMHRGRGMVRDLPSLYELLAVTVRLQLTKLSRRCLQAVFKNDDFWHEGYPQRCSREVVLYGFKELFRTPFRTVDLIQQYLEGVKPSHARLGPPVLNALKTEFDSYEELGLERLPVPFYERRVQVVIAYDPLKAFGLESGIFYDGEFKRVNVFGKNFNLTTDRKIEGFHLKWASYILYLHDGTVYRQDIREATAVKIIGNCIYFLSRGHDVFIITKENSEHRILHWDEDEGSFECIYCTSAELLNIDFCPELRALLVVERRVLVFRFADGVLVLREESEVYGSEGRLLFALFHQDHVLMASECADGTEVGFLENALAPRRIDFESFAEVRSEEFRLFCSSNRVFTSCGKILKRAPTAIGELLVFEDGFEKPLLGPLLHLCSTELALLP